MPRSLSKFTATIGTPLVWNDGKTILKTAETMFGQYAVDKIGEDKWGVWTPDEDPATHNPVSVQSTISRAKVRAQTDFDERNFRMTGVLQLTQAEVDAINERRRQTNQEGWSPENDDEYQFHELANAAAAYAQHAGASDEVRSQPEAIPPTFPFDTEWFKATSRRRDMLKSVALGIAQIEAFDRANNALDQQSE